MKPRAFASLAVLAVLGVLPSSSSAIPNQAAAAATPQPAEKVYDLTSFAAELQRLYKDLETKSSPAGMREFRDGLPPSWNVSVPEHIYSISTKPLRDQLGGNSPDNARVWFSHLQAEIRSAQRLGVQPLPAAHAHLNKILAGREFAGVRPPTYLELLRERVTAWLERMLLRLFSGLERHPIGAKALFWVVLIAGVAFIAFWIFRYIAGRDSMNFFQPGTTTVTARTWQEWIGAAREAAARGDFREAVHSAYWAGISRLQETGTLPQDRAKTPREYLRLIDTKPLGTELDGQPSEDYKKPLAALTSRLERIWYANRIARLEDFDDTLRQLEALGCSLE